MENKMHGIVCGIPPLCSWNSSLESSSIAGSQCFTMLNEKNQVWIFRHQHSSFQLLHQQQLETCSTILNQPCCCHTWCGKDIIFACHQNQIYLLNAYTNNITPFSFYVQFEAKVLAAIHFSDSFLIAVGHGHGVDFYLLEQKEIHKVPATIFKKSPLFHLLIGFGISALCFSEDFLAIAAIDGHIGVWNVANLITIVSSKKNDQDCIIPQKSLEADFIDVLSAPRVTSIKFSPDQNQLVFTTQNGCLYIYNNNPKLSTWEFDLPCRFLSQGPSKEEKENGSCGTFVEWSPDGVFICVGGRNGSLLLEVFDVNSGFKCHQLSLIQSTDVLTGLCSSMVELPDSSFQYNILSHDSSGRIISIPWAVLTCLSI